MDYASKFSQGLAYSDFLAKHGTPEQRDRWNDFHASLSLTSEQQRLLGSFVRQMQVLVMAGTWCGDCVNQCPIFEHFAAASDRLHIRYFDRDAQPDLAEALMTCGAARVPAVVFLSEDGQFCGRYGDRTLSKYRQMASTLVGAACPTGIAEPKSLTSLVIQEWLDEFERIQWMLRTSARLRELHGD